MHGGGGPTRRREPRPQDHGAARYPFMPPWEAKARVASERRAMAAERDTVERLVAGYLGERLHATIDPPL